MQVLRLANDDEAAAMFMDSILDDREQVVYRVEREQAGDRWPADAATKWVGPYVGVTRDWLRPGKHDCRAKHPYLENESVFKEWHKAMWEIVDDEEGHWLNIDCNDMTGAVGGKLAMFSFTSIDQLCAWFDKEDRERMAWVGYVVRAYTVKRAWHFNKQSLYRSDEVLDVQELVMP